MPRAAHVVPPNRLPEFDLLYLFVDGIAERLHLGQPREAVLAAWGVTADGKKVLLHLAPGTKEDTASCREFFQDMRRRGLPDPLLVVSDGAPGAIRAIEECFPRALRQRCLAHKMRNLQSKVPETVWPEFHARAQACYQAASPALARLLREDIVTTYGSDLPAAVACLNDDFEACIAHLRFPLAHRRVIRTTDVLDKRVCASRLVASPTSSAASCRSWLPSSSSFGAVPAKLQRSGHTRSPLVQPRPAPADVAL